MTADRIQMSAPDPSSTRSCVAYLVNHYPKVSHSFIRREILALERQGVTVLRIAVRGWDDVAPDAQDRSEQGRTRYLLQGGALPLVGALIGAALRGPGRFAAALALATRIGWRADRPLHYHWVYLAQACLLSRWITSASHLHAHFGTNPAAVAMLTQALCGVPFSFTVHGPEEFDRPQRLGLAEKIRRAAFVVAVSSFGRCQLYRWIEPGQWRKVRVVHCGLDGEFLHADAALAVTLPKLVCVGRLCEQKGQLLLIDALRQVMDRGVRCELVLVGDGEMRAVIETRVRELGLGHAVRITGWIDGKQVRSELLAARALVLPSFAEGLPVVIMEAMALGRPVISTYVAGIPELVLDGAGGWLVPAGDVQLLAGAMLDCLAAPAAELERMGALAQARVRERHAIDDQATLLLQAIRECAEPDDTTP